MNKKILYCATILLFSIISGVAAAVLATAGAAAFGVSIPSLKLALGFTGFAFVSSILLCSVE